MQNQTEENFKFSLNFILATYLLIGISNVKLRTVISEDSNRLLQVCKRVYMQGSVNPHLYLPVGTYELIFLLAFFQGS